MSVEVSRRGGIGIETNTKLGQEQGLADTITTHTEVKGGKMARLTWSLSSGFAVLPNQYLGRYCQMGSRGSSQNLLRRVPFSHCETVLDTIFYLSTHLPLLKIVHLLTERFHFLTQGTKRCLSRWRDKQLILGPTVEAVQLNAGVQRDASKGGATNK